MFRATSCSSSGESIVSIQHLVYVTLCQWPLRVQIGKFLSDLHTKRSPTEWHIPDAVLILLILLMRNLVMILGKWPTWRTILFYVFISILYMFRANLCSSSGESFVSIQHLVYVTLCQWPFRVQVRTFLSDLHTKRSPTHSDIYQMLYWYNWFSWWWARGCSKHVENWNKHIEKNCASSWSFTKNHDEMHGQQNMKPT